MGLLEMLGQLSPLVGGEITKIATQLPGRRLGVVLGHVPGQSLFGEASVGTNVANVLEELEREKLSPVRELSIE